MPAIVFQNVSKVYQKYASYTHSFLDQVGLGWCIKHKPESLKALDNISFTLRKGSKVGLLGRNGAGKTTLLKLMTQNFKPTSGSVICHGSVQALMQMGLGFHEELSGWNNIRSSLVFNNIPRCRWTKTIDDILDFVELDDFIHAPFKTYSLGMKARLEFAVATSITPDILIVDEVLGAGDGYFSRKSATRMHKLTQKGCTLLMVSHSVSQLNEFCDEGIWLEKGKIVHQGPLEKLTKAYLTSIDTLSDSNTTSLSLTRDSPFLIAHDILKGPLTLKEDALSQEETIGYIFLKGFNDGRSPFQPGDRLVITYIPSSLSTDTKHFLENLPQARQRFFISFWKDDHLPLFKIAVPSFAQSYEHMMDPFLLGGGDYYVYCEKYFSKEDKEKIGSFYLYHANDTSPPLFYHPVTLKINDCFVKQNFNPQQ